MTRPVLLVAALMVWATATHPALAQRAAPAEWGLPALMAALHQVRTSTARFVETKYLRLLNQAQTSTGRLTYVAPDWFQKETLEPIASRLTIHGGRLTIERQGERTREFSLSDYPEFAALTEGVQATLGGDLSELTRDFTVRLDGNPNGWLLTLEPRGAKPRGLVASIRIRGERTAILEIETTEPDGDRTDTIVTPETK